MEKSKSGNVKPSRSVFRIACGADDIKELIKIKLRDEGLSGEKWITVSDYTCLSAWQMKKFLFSAAKRNRFWSVNFVTEDQVKQLGVPYEQGKSLTAFLTGDERNRIDWEGYMAYVDEVRQRLEEATV